MRNCKLGPRGYLDPLSVQHANSPQCQKCAREVYIEGVTARNGGEVAGITKSNGDKATLVNVCTDAKTPCQNYSGPGTKDGAC